MRTPKNWSMVSLGHPKFGTRCPLEIWLGCQIYGLVTTPTQLGISTLDAPPSPERNDIHFILQSWNIMINIRLTISHSCLCTNPEVFAFFLFLSFLKIDWGWKWNRYIHLIKKNWANDRCLSKHP